MAKSYYEILGVAKNASDAEIKRAYRKLALEWHPDRNKASDASVRFKEITKAYEVLSDPKKKELYDQYGEAAFSPGSGFGQQGQSPFSGQGGFGPFTPTPLKFSNSFSADRLSAAGRGAPIPLIS
jgi:DnaJ-class molecular chaperone